MCTFHAGCISRWAAEKRRPVAECCPQRCRVSTVAELDGYAASASDGVSLGPAAPQEESRAHNDGASGIVALDEAVARVTSALNILTSNGLEVTVSTPAASSSDTLPANPVPPAPLAPASRGNVAVVERAGGLLNENLGAAAIVQQLNLSLIHI